MSRKRKTSSRGRRAAVVVLLIIGALVAVLVLGAGAAAVTVSSFAAGDKIAPNVRLSGVEVGGLTPAEAQAALEREFLPQLPAEITLTYPGGAKAVRREELGCEADITAAVERALKIGREPSLLERLRTHWKLRQGGAEVMVALRVDEARLQATLAGLAPQVNREPKDARVVVSGETLRKTPGQSGVKLLLAESAAKVQKALQDARTDQVQLVVKEVPPNISEKDLAGLDKVLASFETPYHTYQRDRTHNMRLAIGKVNGTVLQPGQEFSLNQWVGERTVQEGYRSAPIFRDGKVIPDTGGGVCQVASTLYNVALLANLQVLQRDHHSRPVWYCPTGRDAAVYWGQKDLRFRNSLSHPILLLGEIRGDHLWAACVGSAEDDYDVQLIRSGVATLGYGKVTKPDPTQPMGYKKVDNPGNVGARATLSWKVYKNGKLVKSGKLHDDYYAPVTRVVIVGTKPKPGATTGTAGAATKPGLATGPAAGTGPARSKPGTGPATRSKPARPEPPV